jgi:hypothetical protein
LTLLAFAGKHACDDLDPSALLTRDQIVELTNLDTEFYAHCQLSGLSLSILPEPKDNGHSGFGNSKLPYISGILHLPIKDEAGNVTHEMVARGMMIMPTPEWKYALMSLRATAALKAKAEESGKDQGASQSITSDKNEDDQGTARKSETRKRGRPPGSETKKEDLKLYLHWKAADQTNRVTKAEFLRARGLPKSALAAIERGRKQERNNRPGKNSWKQFVKAFLFDSGCGGIAVFPVFCC